MIIPKQPAWLHFRSDHWPVVVQALNMMATTGISIRFELQERLASPRGIGPRSGSMRRIFEHDLPEAGLIESDTLPTFGRHKLSVVQLTERGKELCRTFDWTVVHGEWERLQALHSADSQPKHTGAVLTFAYHARLRGWNIVILPDVDSQIFFPDVFVEDEFQQMYVEVELGSRKGRKWSNMQKEQGFVALCAKTPASRSSLIAECKNVKAVGFATDLVTLYQESKGSEAGPLWAEEWSS